MNTYRVTIERNWKTEIVEVQATTRKYAEGQLKNKDKNITIEKCVKVGCNPVKPELNIVQCPSQMYV